jgi:hypothetical protein
MGCCWLALRKNAGASHPRAAVRGVKADVLRPTANRCPSSCQQRRRQRPASFPSWFLAASSERAQGSKNDGWEKPGGGQGHHTFLMSGNWKFQLCHFSFDVLQVKHALSFFVVALPRENHLRSFGCKNSSLGSKTRSDDCRASEHSTGHGQSHLDA